MQPITVENLSCIEATCKAQKKLFDSMDTVINAQESKIGGAKSDLQPLYWFKLKRYREKLPTLPTLLLPLLNMKVEFQDWNERHNSKQNLNIKNFNGQCMQIAYNNDLKATKSIYTKFLNDISNEDCYKIIDFLPKEYDPSLKDVYALIIDKAIEHVNGNDKSAIGLEYDEEQSLLFVSLIRMFEKEPREPFYESLHV